MILTGEIIDAEEAWRIGLVDELVNDDMLRERTLRLARTMAAQSPVAVRLAKAAVAPPGRRPWPPASPRTRTLHHGVRQR
jgi:enoyl-CoA hydratase